VIWFYPSLCSEDPRGGGGPGGAGKVLIPVKKRKISLDSECYIQPVKWRRYHNPAEHVLRGADGIFVLVFSALMFCPSSRRTITRRLYYGVEMLSRP
jgi:hypothetical protein